MCYKTRKKLGQPPSVPLVGGGRERKRGASVPGALALPHFRDRDTTAQRGSATYPRPHSFVLFFFF